MHTGDSRTIARSEVIKNNAELLSTSVRIPTGTCDTHGKMVLHISIGNNTGKH